MSAYETLYGRSNPLRSAVNNDSQQSLAKLADVLIETLDCRRRAGDQSVLEEGAGGGITIHPGHILNFPLADRRRDDINSRKNFVSRQKELCKQTMGNINLHRISVE